LGKTCRLLAESAEAFSGFRQEQYFSEKYRRKPEWLRYLALFGV